MKIKTSVVRSFKMWKVGKCATVILSILFCFSVGLLAFADSVPPYINYQGRLTKSIGNAIDGTKKLQFNLYDAAIGGEVKWGPFDVDNVPVVNGYFNVILGDKDSSPQTISIIDAFENGDRYLGIKLGEPGQNLDGPTMAEISPRQKILCSPFAVVAKSLGPDVYFNQDENALKVNDSLEVENPPKGGGSNNDNIWGAPSPIRGADFKFILENLPDTGYVSCIGWTDTGQTVNIPKGKYLVVYSTSTRRKDGSRGDMSHIRLRSNSHGYSSLINLAGYGTETQYVWQGNAVLFHVFDFATNDTVTVQITDNFGGSVRLFYSSFIVIRIG